jgi:hypothetical protein
MVQPPKVVRRLDGAAAPFIEVDVSARAVNDDFPVGGRFVSLCVAALCGNNRKQISALFLAQSVQPIRR